MRYRIRSMVVISEAIDAKDANKEVEFPIVELPDNAMGISMSHRPVRVESKIVTPIPHSHQAPTAQGLACLITYLVPEGK